MPFFVATGIECSAPRIKGGVRRDELILTGHRDRVEEDLDLVVDLGITHLRYGIPFHVVAHDPARLDWSWTDRAMAAIRERGIEPIVDLLHFAVPDDLWGIGDPRLPDRYAAYVQAFVDRYPWASWYTPVNEPFITALFSAKNGWWNEQRRSDRAFVRALDNVATCGVEGMRLIRQRRSDAIFLQSDACESFTATDAAAQGSARFFTDRAYLGFDLTFGRPVSAAMRAWLRRAGMPASRQAWFERYGSDEGCIVGLDYYEGNERLVDARGNVSPALRRGFAAIAREVHARYGLPMMLAETNNHEARAVDWLAETWNDTVEMRDAGLPIRGFCWYSLTDQVDWDTCMREANDTVNSFGLVDMSRVRRPVGHAYEALARQAQAGITVAMARREIRAA
jgi:beta-glucosidase/6-phospho-beta-glucosidase/beta-galactosidase